eukprot:SAG31_NODE_21047_length_559_cov_0.676087_2_plen_50_part_01
MRCDAELAHALAWHTSDSDEESVLEPGDSVKVFKGWWHDAVIDAENEDGI